MTTEAAPGPAGPQRATAREFFAVVFRRRWIILGLFAMTLGTVLAVSFGGPRVYVSTGQVLVRRGEQQSAMQPQRSVTSEWEVELGSEIQTARSWPVLQRAQRTLDEKRRGLPRVVLSERGVVVEITGKSNVLEISYRSRDPQAAEQACDAVMQAYIDYREAMQISYPRRFFDREIGQAAAELARWTEQRREFENRTGIVDLAVQRSHLVALRSGFEQRRMDAMVDLAEATSEYRIAGDVSRDPDRDVPSGSQMAANEGSLQFVKGRVIEQEGRIARLRERYRDDSPEMMSAQATLDTLRGLLRREVEIRHAVARSRVDVARSKVDAASRAIADVNAQLARLPDLEAQAAEMDNQIATWRERYSELTRSSDQALVNENTVQAVSVILLQPPSPARLQQTRDYVRLGLAPAFSLVVGVGLAFFVDGLDLTVRTSAQAEEEVRLPVLATLTERRKRGWRLPHGRKERAA